MLQSVNDAVNAIPYQGKVGTTEPFDFWHVDPLAGQSWVCRDYVLAKAQQLRQYGVPPASLIVLLCWVEPPSSGYHAVLGVLDDDNVTWVLDSRFENVYRMDSPPAPYTWDRRQVPGTTEFVKV